MNFKITWAGPSDTTISTGPARSAWASWLLCYGLLNYLQAVLPAKFGAESRVASMVLFFAGVLLMLGLILWITKAIKKHITWPRTGYVAFRRSGKSSWKAIAFAAVGGAGSVCLFELAARHNAMNLAEAVYLAVLVGAYAIFIYRFSREHPWKWLVVIFMALGAFRDDSHCPVDFNGVVVLLCCCSSVLRGSDPVGLLCICTFGTHNRPTLEAE
jgi:hypothetical protein